jgi:P-type Cu+ transporter
MTCAACQSHVQRALRGTPGVTTATVNLMMHSATVAYDPGVLTPDTLVARINDAGYQSRLPEPQVDAVAEDEAREAAQGAEYRAYLRKSLISLAVGAVAMLLSMPLMGGGAHGAHVAADPLQAWVMRTIEPPFRAAVPALFAVDPSLLSYTLLALTVFVMGWAGRHFYTRAWKAVRHGTADMNALVAVGTGSAFLYSATATVAPGVFTSTRRRTRRVLRSDCLHPRAAVARPCAGGARQDEDHGRAAGPGAAAARQRPRPPAATSRWTLRSRRSAPARW